MDIDFVIPWVDGSDPKWLEEKNKYSSQKIDDSNSINRYRDWGILPFWFRAVEKYTPWVNKIHFITCGHLPEFLNVHHPKLHIVRHEDYIPPKYLPVFSSHPIEINMHRIEGLSEHFVYFNDDMFIIRPMTKEHFFVNELPCIYGAECPIIPFDRAVWEYAAFNDIAIINKHFSKNNLSTDTVFKMLSRKYLAKDCIRSMLYRAVNPNVFLGFKNMHAPAPFLKSTFTTLWQEEEEILDATSSHKFRDIGDVNQWLFLWWQVASGNFEPYRTDNFGVPLSTTLISTLESAITNQSHDMICINDPSDDIDFDFLSKRLIKAFETILPEKSSFES